MANTRNLSNNLTPFHQCIVDVIRRIPRGKVASYGQVAAIAGEPRAARQVVRVLHSLSDKHRLPWHRVINKQGRISLPKGGGFELQMSLLKKEGIRFGLDDVAINGRREARIVWTSPKTASGPGPTASALLSTRPGVTTVCKSKSPTTAPAFPPRFLRKYPIRSFPPGKPAGWAWGFHCSQRRPGGAAGSSTSAPRKGREPV